MGIRIFFARTKQQSLFLKPFNQSRTPQLCVSAFQSLQSWWYTDFSSKVMTLLETVGLCVLIFAYLLYHIEKTIFNITAMISSMTPVACYVLVFHQFFPLPVGRTTIIGLAHVFGNNVVVGRDTLAVDIDC